MGIEEFFDNIISVKLTEGGELNILGEGVEIPSMHTFNNARRNHPAGTRNSAASTHHHTGVIQELCLTHKPGSIGRTYPARIKIL